MATTTQDSALTPEQKYEFDLQGYIVPKGHYDQRAVAELQAIPIDYETYSKLGGASYYLSAAMKDPEHPFWQGERRPDQRPNPDGGGGRSGVYSGDVLRAWANAPRIG